MNKLGDDQLSLIQLPFKNKNYQAFAVARLTKQAVDEGYDGVIFLTGAEQARRNDMGVQSVISSIQSEEVTNASNMIPASSIPASGEMPVVKQINIINPEGDNIFDGLVDAETGRYIPGTNSTDDRAFLETTKDGAVQGKELTEIVPSKDTVKQLLDEDTTVEVGDMILDETGYKTLYDVAIPKRLRQIVDRTNVKDKPEVRKMDIEVDQSRSKIEQMEMDASYKAGMLQTIEATTDPDGMVNLTRRLSGQRHNDLILGMDEFIMNPTAHPIDGAQLVVAREMLSLGRDMLKNPGAFNLATEPMDSFSIADALSTAREAYQNDPDMFKYIVMRLEDTIDEGGNMMFADYSGVDFDVNAAAQFVEAELDDGAEFVDRTRRVINVLREEADDTIGAEGSRIVKGNNGIYFTEEFKKHVSEMGLPRMRKGGLVSPK